MYQHEIDTIKHAFSLSDLLKRKQFVRKVKTLPALDVALVQKLAEANMDFQVATETNTDTGEIVFVYVGLVGIGIVAQYNAADDAWYECYSHGNFGKNAAYGGTWSSGEKTKDLPKCLINYFEQLKLAKSNS